MTTDKAKAEHKDEHKAEQAAEAETPSKTETKQQTAESEAQPEIAADLSDMLPSEDDEGADATDANSLKDQLLRAMADTENLRRRSDRDIAAAKKYGAVGLARDLLSSIDNLEKAIALIPEDKTNIDEQLKNILIGIDMSGRELATVLEKHNIKKINPEGEKFDYNFHQAMFEVEHADIEAGTVVQVVQPGYVLHDRLLRPAMVGVSKSPSETNKDDG